MSGLRSHQAKKTFKLRNYYRMKLYILLHRFSNFLCNSSIINVKISLKYETLHAPPGLREQPSSISLSFYQGVQI